MGVSLFEGVHTTHREFQCLLLVYMYLCVVFGVFAWGRSAELNVVRRDRPGPPRWHLAAVAG